MEILLRWNRIHNLTKVIEPEEIITHHLLDSLSIASLIRGEHVIDVGSGGGFPGIPLALALPDTRWTLVDSRGKRARFLEEVVDLLGLERVEVVHQRIEHYLPEENFDTLVARAVASLASLFNMTDHLLHHHLRLIAMKGTHPQAELDALAPAQRLAARVIPVTVPGLSAQRHLVVLDGLPGRPT